MTCPSHAELAQAASGENPTVQEHASACVLCAPLWQNQIAIAQIALLVREQESEPLDAQRRRMLAGMVLARAESADVHVESAEIEATAVNWPNAEVANGSDESEAKPPGGDQIAKRRRLRKAVLAGAVIAVSAAAVALWLARGTASDGVASQIKAGSNLDHGVLPATVAPRVGSGHVGSPTEKRVASASVVATPVAVGNASFSLRAGANNQYVIDHGEVTVEATSHSGPISVAGNNAAVFGRRAKVAITAKSGVLMSVAVFAGSVEVSTKAKMIVISAGEQWQWTPDQEQTPSEGDALERGREGHAVLQPTRESSRQVAKTNNSNAPGPDDSPLRGSRGGKGENPAPQLNARDSGIGRAATEQPAATTGGPNGRDANDVKSLGPTLPKPGHGEDERTLGAGGFAGGFAAFKAGEFATAVNILRPLVRDAAVGEDATYWLAVSYQRLGDSEQAKDMFASYLHRFADGSRADECHLALGQLFASSNRATARAHLEHAANSQVTAVRVAAMRELERLRKSQ